MNDNERFKRLLEADDAQKAAIDAIFTGQSQPARVSCKLFKTGEAARETNLSRCTIWRAIKDGRLKVVEIRKGSFRIPEAELRKFAGAA